MLVHKENVSHCNRQIIYKFDRIAERKSFIYRNEHETDDYKGHGAANMHNMEFYSYWFGDRCCLKSSLTRKRALMT